MDVFFGIQHAAFDEERRRMLPALLKALAGETVCVVEDHKRSGAWAPFRACLEEGIRQDADWIVVLNDDAVPCEYFTLAIRNALAAHAKRSSSRTGFPCGEASSRDSHTTRTGGAAGVGAAQVPCDDPIYFYANHPGMAAGDGWYTTHDGLVGVCCALSRKGAQDFLAWHDTAMLEPVRNSDLPVTLWAMATRRLCWCTSPSLVEHGCPDTSLRGHETDGMRTSVVPPRADVADLDWADLPVRHLGLRYAGNHWTTILRMRPETWDVEASYLAARCGRPVAEHPLVLIATMCYKPALSQMRASREAVEADLKAHGYQVGVLETPGDALVGRGRNAIVHAFLKTRATHLLFWDSDLECLDPSAVRKMLETKHPLIGCAYPYRNEDRKGVVASPLPEDVQRGRVDRDTDDTVRAAEVGTGFMLIQRDVVTKLMEAHPELLYVQDTGTTKHEIAWNLFGTEVVDRRLLSEDWCFCRRWREIEGEVRVYLPPRFRHWGMIGHEGHVEDAWGSALTSKSDQAREAAE